MGKGWPSETECFSETSGIGGGTARTNKAGSSVQVTAIRFIAGPASLPWPGWPVALACASRRYGLNEWTFPSPNSADSCVNAAADSLWVNSTAKRFLGREQAT